jgi:hypothetical protein
MIKKTLCTCIVCQIGLHLVINALPLGVGKADAAATAKMTRTENQSGFIDDKVPGRLLEFRWREMIIIALA